MTAAENPSVKPTIQKDPVKPFDFFFSFPIFFFKAYLFLEEEGGAEADS